MFLKGIFGLIFIVFLAGCSTTRPPTSVNQLQIRMAQIENQLDEQGEDVNELKYAVETLVTSVDRLVESRSSTRSTQRSTTKTAKSSNPNPNPNPNPSSSPSPSSGLKDILRVPATPQEVQEALKISGYYDGAIDGKLGSGSQKAIKDFQMDHDLQSDGIVGKKTWAELKNYLQ